MRMILFCSIVLSSLAAPDVSARQVAGQYRYEYERAMQAQIEALRNMAARQRAEAARMAEQLRRQMQEMASSQRAESARIAAEARRQVEEVNRALQHLRPATTWPAWPSIQEPFAPQDPADSLYRQGRRLLNRSAYRDAASVFRVIRTDERYRASAYRPSAYLYEAMALARVGVSDALREARQLLAQLQRQYPDDRLIRNAEALDVEIAGRLARGGDAVAAAQVARRAAQRGQCASEDDDIRLTALNALLHMDAANAVPILREIMARRDQCSAQLRRQAVFLLSQKRGQGIDQILLDALRNDPDPEVREAAVYWLSQVNTSEAVAALQNVLRESSDGDVQEKALFALSQNRSERATQVLRDFASRSDVPSELRRHAIFHLGQRRGSGNAAFLRTLYSQIQDVETKEHILHSIAQVRDPQNGEWLLEIALREGESSESRKRALFYAAQQGALPIQRIGQLYDNARDRELKEHVLFALSQRLRDPAAVEKLMDIGRKETDPELRKTAVFWLSQSRDPRVSAFLLEIIKR